MRNVGHLGFFWSFLTALALFFSASGRVWAAAEDSVRTEVTPAALAGTFMYQPDSFVRVNESEIRAGLLYDAVNQKIVWEKNMSSSYPIASLTKMMVALLAVEDVRAGKYRWEDRVQWVRETVVGRRKHRRIVRTIVNYSLYDVFKASMIASNNECADQMARFLGGGDLASTLRRMNERAVSLGMTNSWYGNPTGLPGNGGNPDNYSSPTDQLRLALEMLKYEEILEVTGQGYAQIDNGKSNSIIRNHNGLTIQYTGEVDGLKTGYTRRAGFCLVGTTAKCGHRLISVVLGCRGPALRNELVRDLFNSYYTSIHLDPLGPCVAPSAILAARAPVGIDTVKSTTNSKGEFITVKEKVRKQHTVRKGETLSGIANRYGVSMAQIRSWNKGRIKSSRVMAGQRLSVYTTVSRKVWMTNPANGGEEDDNETLLAGSKTTVKETDTVDSSEAKVDAKPVPAKQKPVFIYHTIAPGDTLFSIARRYQGTSVEQLKKINNIHNIRSLKPGQKLKVPVKG